MNIAAYFNRIGYQGSIQKNYQTLRDIQKNHLLNVPFENLDVHQGKAIALSPDALFNKIVEQRRGGFCYEVNGLLAEVLKNLGFRVSLLSAQVARKQGEFGPDYDHLLLLVHLDEPWLVDVGFGESFPEPLRLRPQASAETSQDYQLMHDGSYWLVQSRKRGTWQTQFRFKPDAHPFPAFREMCHYHQTSPESKFTRHRLCSRATPEGRITLVDQRLIITQRGDRQETRLKSETEYHQALADHFQISMLQACG
ncbi:MAG: arylamine N-acetyltransferase [Oculatellaceae cyanobacterium Prado106]|nr:arylamine N-acetyltransferase [Oculatellaceae cyanobacterium Prado106]